MLVWKPEASFWDDKLTRSTVKRLVTFFIVCHLLFTNSAVLAGCCLEGKSAILTPSICCPPIPSRIASGVSENDDPANSVHNGTLSSPPYAGSGERRARVLERPFPELHRAGANHEGEQLTS